MLLITILFLGSLAATAGVGFWLFRRFDQWSLLDRLIATLTPSLILILIEVLLIEVLTAPYGSDRANLNGIRLTPIFGLVHGYPLYYYPNSGPALGNMYGPMTALVYLPATLFSSPTGAIVTAALVSTLLSFLPLLWLHLGQRPTAPQKWWAAIAFLIFGGFVLKTPALSYSAFAVHADAPALGLAALACACLYYRKDAENWLPLGLSAVFAVLSLWSKQTLVPIVVALPLYLLLIRDYRSCYRYLLCLGVALLSISTLFLLLFGPERIVFNLVQGPASHEWEGGRSLKTFLRGAQELWLVSQPFLQLLGLSLILQISLWLGRRQQRSVPALATNRWLMLVILAVLLIPMSILGRIKIGGDINALSMTTYFLAAASTLALVEVLQDWSVAYQPWIQSCSKGLLLVLAVSLVLRVAPVPADLNWALNNLSTNPHEVAYQYAKQHPGEVFFPHDALASLLAEGKLYHLDDGFYALQAAHLAVSEAEFRAYTPAKLKWIADLKGDVSFTLRYLPNFKPVPPPPELDGWVVMAAPPSP